MKDKFYNFINFLSSELHFFEYIFYCFLIAFAFYLTNCYELPLYVLERIISIILALAFMNTWEIKARSWKKKKDVNKNE